MKPNTPIIKNESRVREFSTGQAGFLNSTKWGSGTSVIGSLPTTQESILSPETRSVIDQIRALEKNRSELSETRRKGKNTLAEQLFDARAKVKILFSKVSMHFDKELRARIFDQIDRIHELDDWEDGDLVVQEESFSTFLRWYYLTRPNQLPNLGLTSKGILIASWVANANRDVLVFEFLPKDKMKWFVTKYFEGEAEQFIGKSDITRSRELLLPIRPEDWFFEA